ncbi:MULTISPECIES: hypothetical protein [Maribacter]|uniref:DUF5017 domain-containing protein n=1 Tax=Maribacter flavus TaxID=1658664 RepID=A0ABU7IHR8_9FLAO|nr:MULTISPECIES: hypothetical protein [Maribacter]MDC6405057.1 hypothetical protein [Maribacter sp. PR66]MEE1972471.1 hypothetical protein [Maribacter flavus]
MKFLKSMAVVLAAYTIISCNSKVDKSKIDYDLVSDDDGILVEKFDSTQVDINKYNKNNMIYKVGISFKYDFEHLTTTGEKKYFKIDDNREGWEFVSSEAEDSLVVKSLIIQVMNGNPMAQFIPDYNQTAIAYKLIPGIPFTMSGVIENEANIWVHPPREHYFSILELNPFPYIKAPYEIGTQWNWKLKIGSQWADHRWKIWEGNIENNYHYEITNKVKLQTNFGELVCLVIESTAESSLGTTHLTTYFNANYGFVKLNYTNIDGSRTHLELSEHWQK